MKRILEFLSELSLNNNREWFNANKEKYLTAKNDFENTISLLISKIQAFDGDLGPVEAKQALFRIYRDVRFSKNKSPYKTNFGAAIAKGGKKMGYSGYYLHIEPGASFIGAGLYKPPSPVLKKIRNEVYYNTARFLDIINHVDFVKELGGLQGEMLKRPPKDFPIDFEHIDLLKLKSYVVMKSFSDDQVLSNGFMKEILISFKAMKDFNYFLNQALDA